MTVETQFLSLVNRITVSINTLNGFIGDLDTLPTTDKSSLINSLIELKGIVDSHYSEQQALINDNITSSTKTWSSYWISHEINLAITELIDGAPGALNTLKELANALQNNPDIIASLNDIINKRVAVDVVQSFSTLEQTLGRANINAASDTEVQQLLTGLGNYNTNFAAIFTNALI